MVKGKVASDGLQYIYNLPFAMLILVVGKSSLLVVNGNDYRLGIGFFFSPHGKSYCNLSDIKS